MRAATYPRPARERSSFPYVFETTKPFGKLDEIISWCKSEMQGEWRWQLVRTSTDREPGLYVFYFDLERDACAFTLQWC